MTTSSAATTDLAAQWHSLRQVHSLYTNLAREFALDMPACGISLELDPPTQEAADSLRRWLVEVDRLVPVHYLRQYLQTSSSTDGDGLQALLKYCLAKTERGAADRDKIDFLLVQYASQQTTAQPGAEVSREQVAGILEAMLGADSKASSEFKKLDELVLAAGKCKSLKQLLESNVLRSGREFKDSLGAGYYAPAALVAFTGFNLSLRRTFFRLMHEDLSVLLEGLRKLEAQGVTTLDCRRAEFSGDEPISRLRTVCQSWRVLFQAEYSSGQPLRMLVDLREIVESALTGTKTASSSATVLVQAKAAAAGQSSSGDSASTHPGKPKKSRKK